MFHEQLIGLLIREYSRHPIFFYKQKVIKYLNNIVNAASQDDADAKFTKFATDMLTIVDVLITVNNGEFQKLREDGAASTQNSAKKIAGILNAGQLTKRDGTKVRINIEDYLDVEAFKKNKNSQLFLALIKIKMNLENCLAMLAKNKEHRNFLITYNNNESFQNLMKERAEVTKALDLALEAFKKFEKDIKKLYKVTASQLFGQQYVNVLAPTLPAHGVTELRAKFKASFPDKPALLLMGDYPTDNSISKQMQAVYLGTLSRIRAFNLTLAAESETAFLPEVVVEKQKIMANFNRLFNTIFTKLPLTQKEIELKKTPLDLSCNDLDDVPEEKSETQPLCVNILVLSRYITEADLFASDTLQITLKKDPEYLLAEAEYADRIIQVYKYSMIASAVFAETPNHLKIQLPEVKKSDLEKYLKSLEDTMAATEVSYHSHIASFGEDIHNFKQGKELLQIYSQITIIAPEMRALSSNIPTADESPETLQKLRNRLTVIDAQINDVTNQLKFCIDNHPQKMYVMKKLTLSYNSLAERIKPLRGIFTTLQQDYDLLASEFKDRKRQALIEIVTIIKTAKRLLDSLEKGICVYTQPLANNLAGQIGVACNKLETELNDFNQCIAQAINSIATQRILLTNAQVTRYKQLGFADNKHRLVLSSPIPPAEPVDSKQEGQRTMQPFK
jgi:hypothetical protein